MSSSCIGKAMGHLHHIPQKLRFGLNRFRRDERGVALVEFALLLPLMLVIFAVTVESARLFWSYQSTVSGVRDAARFLGRVVPSDICTSGGSVSGYTSDVTTLVTQGASGASVVVGGVTVNSVTPSYSCVTGDYRGGTVAVGQVSANLTITFPFASIFTLAGSTLGTIDVVVSDRSRVFGT